MDTVIVGSIVKHPHANCTGRVVSINGSNVYVEFAHDGGIFTYGDFDIGTISPVVPTVALSIPATPPVTESVETEATSNE